MATWFRPQSSYLHCSPRRIDYSKSLYSFVVCSKSLHILRGSNESVSNCDSAFSQLYKSGVQWLALKVKQDRFTTCFNDLWNRFVILEGGSGSDPLD